MPDDKDQIPKPDESPEEKKYSFLQETIKPKPISRQQLAKQLVRIAIYGLILGAFACLGFFALKPWMQDLFRGNLETVTIPEDEEPSEDEDASQGEETDSAAVTEAEDFQQIIDSMNERAEEAKKGIATVQQVSDQTDWDAEMTGIGQSVTGVITADNGQELLILADSSICTDASEWTVTFDDGKSYTAALKKQDLNTGLAMFSVSRGNISDTTWNAIKVSVLGNSNLVKQGDVVMALGTMFGYPDGMSYGMISSADYKTAFYDGECDVLATDIVSETRGTGVLFNIDGEVIGLISPTVWNDNDSNAANAYAISDLKSVIEIMANGESVPYIGIYGTTVTAELEKKQGMPSGVYVVDVDPDSPAMEAGIQSGDIICQVGDDSVSSIMTYQSAVLKIKAGGQVTVRGMRLGADGYVDVKFTVTAGSREQDNNFNYRKRNNMRYINGLHEGETIRNVYLCKGKRSAETRNGKPYDNLILQDKTGTLDGKVWDPNSQGIADYDEKDFIEVYGDVISYNGNLQLNIRQIRKAEEGEYEPADYMPTTDKNVEKMYAGLTAYIGKISNTWLRQLLEYYFVKDEEFIRKFKAHSAAKTVHHGFSGGLLEHTLSVVHMCDYFAGAYPILNRDLLITAAICHDIGKIKELSSFPDNDYTDEGQLIGHIVIGVEMVDEAIRSIPDFPERLANELKHCIIAHHGELEYGSPKKPALAEAMALNLADNADAKMQTLTEIFKGKTGTEWLGYNRLFESNLRRTSGA